MFIQNHLKTFFAILALATLGFLTACNRADDPIHESQTEVERRIHLHKDMTEAEYLNALDILQNPGEAPTDAAPRPQGLLANKTFTLTYQNHATIFIGGVAYDRPLDQWYAGSTAGTTTIPPSLFAQLMDSAPRSIRVQIGDNPYWWWPTFALRTITVTLLDQGDQQISGLYDVYTREYLFLGAGSPAGGELGTTSCGAINVGRLNGHFNPGITALDGELSNGFIAGCVPVVVAASISFFFNGTANP